ncbi:pirin family protein [Colwelliaceae bacterium 6441]
MITLRKADERGHASYGWLDTRYTFSFAHYYDPKHMGVSALRVINDDVIQPAGGFDTHGHRDMEIITYVLEGVIEHKDSQGNTETLPGGEFQLMSAGKGIYHSEYNASNTHPLRVLQIWIEPNTRGNTPEYQQKNFGQAYGLTSIVTPTGENNSLKIKQNAKLLQLILKAGESFEFTQSIGKQLYIHQVDGGVTVNGEQLIAGDGAKIINERLLNFNNQSHRDAKVFIFELP